MMSIAIFKFFLSVPQFDISFNCVIVESILWISFQEPVLEIIYPHTSFSRKEPYIYEETDSALSDPHPAWHGAPVLTRRLSESK